MFDILALKYITSDMNSQENFIFNNDDDDDDNKPKLSLKKFIKDIFRFQIKLTSKWFEKEKHHKKSNKTIGFKIMKYIVFILTICVTVTSVILSLNCNKNSSQLMRVVSFILSMMFPLLYIIKFLIWNIALGYSCNSDQVAQYVNQAANKVQNHLSQTQQNFGQTVGQLGGKIRNIIHKNN